MSFLRIRIFTQDLGVLASIGFTIYHPYPIHTKPQQNRMTIPIIPLPTFRERDPSLGVWRGLPVTHKTSTKQEDTVKCTSLIFRFPSSQCTPFSAYCQDLGILKNTAQIF